MCSSDLSDHLLEEEGVRRALRDLMRRGFTSEDGQRSVKGMRDFLREADEKRRELLNKYSPDSFKLTPEEQKSLSEKLNSLAEKLEKYHGSSPARVRLGSSFMSKILTWKSPSCPSAAAA